MSICFGITKDLGLRLSMARARLLRQLFVECSDVVKARGVFIGYSPLTVEYVALVAHVEINHVVPDHKSKTLKQRLIGKSLLEAVSSVLNQAIQDIESADLTMGVAILATSSQPNSPLSARLESGSVNLQLLANSPGSLGGSRRLNANDFNQIDDSAEIVFLILLAGHAVNLDRHSRVWLSLLSNPLS
jgi:hypothetical protein